MIKWRDGTTDFIRLLGVTQNISGDVKMGGEPDPPI